MSMGGIARMGGKRGRGRPMSDINVTPLVDVMLVLLVIFMITAPVMDKENIDIALPQAKGAPGVGEPVRPMSMVVDSNGRVHVGGKSLELAEIGTELPKILKGREKETLTLKAHRSLPYDTVVKVISVIRGAGVRGINIAVEAPAK